VIGLSIYRKEKLNRNTHNTVLIPCQIHATDTENNRGDAEVHPHFGPAEPCDLSTWLVAEVGPLHEGPMGDERNSKTNKRKDAPSQDHGINHDSPACGDDETNSEE